MSGQRDQMLRIPVFGILRDQAAWTLVVSAIVTIILKGSSFTMGGEPMRVARKVELSSEDRAVLEQQARGRSLPARLVERSRIVLLAA